MILRKKVLILFITVLLTLLAACAKPDTPDKEDIDPNDVYSGDPSTGKSDNDKDSTNDNSSDAFDPYTEFDLTDEQMKTLDKAEELILKKCMKKLGFDYKEVELPKLSNEEMDESKKVDSTWGPTDPDYAAKYGYSLHANDDLMDAMAFDPEKETPAEKAYREALHGKEGENPPYGGGCSLEASAGMLAIPNWKANWERYSQIRQTAGAATAQDKRIAEVINKWSSCMKEQGYEYASPKAAMEDAWDYNQDQKELDTAKAHAQCLAKADLMQVVKKVKLEYDKQAIENNRPFFEELKQMQLLRLEWAQKVIAES